MVSSLNPRRKGRPVVVTNTRVNQVMALIRKYVAQHHLERGDRLPSESEMARELGVSRNTLREAYVALENDGLIIRRHGIGTFVAQPAIIRDSLHAFASFAQIVEAAGYSPHFQTLAMETVVAPPAVCDAFSVPAGQKFFYLKRVVFADQEPAIYLNDYLAPLVQQAQPDWGTFDGNLVQFLASVLETPLHHIHSRICAVLLEEEAARILRVSPGTPALYVRSTIYAITNQPVTYSDIWFNPHIVELDAVRQLRYSR
ncbi:MAG: GntR family transcriptional regulator [Caldilineae bacterium]|nr:MAG: GntR family transcriptional regulator [Caldilineae bacterium]